MRLCAAIGFVMITVLFVNINSMAQVEKKWGKGKFTRYYRKHVLRQKDPEKLRSALEDALEKTEGRFNIFFALALGGQYERSGDFTMAEKVYLDAYSQTKNMPPRVLKSYLPFGAGTVYDSFDRLGYFYLKTGNLRRAEQIFGESKTVRDELYPPRSVHRVHPIVGLGSLYFRKGDYDKTYELFNQAIKAMNHATTTHYDYDHLNRLFLIDLAELCLALGKNNQAEKYITDLSIASSGVMKFTSSIARKIEVARIFELKARYYLLEGDFERAQEYLDRANDFNPGKLVVSDVQFKILKTQALLHWYMGNIELANASFKELVTNYRQHIALNFVSMSEYEKEQFYNTLKNDFNLFNAYVLEINQSHPTLLYEEMYNNIINTKALLLNETNRQKNRIIQSGDQTLISKLHEWERAKTLLASQYFESKSQSRIDSLEKNIEILEKEINKTSALFRKKESHSDWHQVQSKLKPGEAALEIVRINTVSKARLNGYAKNSGLTDSTVYGVLMQKYNATEPEYFFIPDGNNLEQKFLRFYRNSIFGQVEDNVSYDQFWLPIKKHLAGIERVFISPDGVFNQINLNTLKNPMSGKYLIDEMELVYLTNTADMLREKQVSPLPRTAVLFGRPSYKLEATAASTKENQVAGYGLRNIITEELMDFKEQDFADLPGTEAEIGQIEKELLFKQLKVVTFKGVDALEENVKAVKHPAILHIATHGFFVQDSASLINPMIRSGVVLAGVQNIERKNTEDGILTAYEATNLDLENTKLVVLSACQTGVGEIRNGEGVYGLQRAIIVAGAENLLMSLWKVDDEATARLMVSLYKTWNGENNILAFRDAQLALRATYPEPFYWGAFIMLGN